MGSDFTHGTLVPGRVPVECRHFRDREMSPPPLQLELVWATWIYPMTYTHTEKERVPTPVSHTRSGGSFCRLGLLDWSFQAKKKKKKGNGWNAAADTGDVIQWGHLFWEMCWFPMSPGTQAASRHSQTARMTVAEAHIESHECNIKQSQLKLPRNIFLMQFYFFIPLPFNTGCTITL